MRTLVPADREVNLACNIASMLQATPLHQTVITTRESLATKWMCYRSFFFPLFLFSLLCSLFPSFAHSQVVGWSRQQNADRCSHSTIDCAHRQQGAAQVAFHSHLIKLVISDYSSPDCRITYHSAILCLHFWTRPSHRSSFTLLSSTTHPYSLSTPAVSGLRIHLQTTRFLVLFPFFPIHQLSSLLSL